VHVENRLVSAVMAMGFSFDYMDSALGAGSDCTDMAVDDSDCTDSLIDNSAALRPR
jgi:hypothetical protein